MKTSVDRMNHALVKVTSKLTGSGVWLNLGLTDYSYVLTAKHNIDDKNDDEVEVFDYNNKKLTVIQTYPLDGMDVTLIKIKEICHNDIELCLENNDQKSNELDNENWILGYPKSLIDNDDDESIEHEGSIYFKKNKIYFKIEEHLPKYRDEEYIEGFSGGPIFECSNENIYLKGIITDRFDEDFEYQRVLGTTTKEIFHSLPKSVKLETCYKNKISDLIDSACQNLDDKMAQYILENNIIEHLENINLDSLEKCNYFYLPDDKEKTSQHQSLLKNKGSIEKYIHSRILSTMMNDNIQDIDINPSSFNGNKLYTIHITNFRQDHQLIAKLIRQENSFEFSDSTLLIIYPDNNNSLKYVNKKRISKVIANYAECREPDLYDNRLPFKKRNIVNNFLKTRKDKKLKFSIINIQFLIEMITQQVENNLYGDKYDEIELKDEITGVFKQYE